MHCSSWNRCVVFSKAPVLARGIVRSATPLTGYMFPYVFQFISCIHGQQYIHSYSMPEAYVFETRMFYAFCQLNHCIL